MLCSVQFFLSLLKSGREQVSMVTSKWLFRHLPRSESKSKINSAKKKQENRRFGVTKAFIESSVSRGKFWTFSSLPSYDFLLKAYVPNQTDSWCERLRFRTRANVGMFFTFQWWQVEIGQDEIFLLVCTAKGVSVENLRNLRVSKTFRKRQSLSKLQLCRFSNPN